MSENAAGGGGSPDEYGAGDNECYGAVGGCFGEGGFTVRGYVAKGSFGKVSGKRYAFGDCIPFGHKVSLTAYLFPETFPNYTVGTIYVKNVVDFVKNAENIRNLVSVVVIQIYLC